LQHLGLYAYRRPFLLRLAELPPAHLEQLEKLEQLRVLALGCRIQVGIVRHTSVGVDTPEDYDRFVQLVREHAA
jgi:3-deoxy-manno-octulosonate cytidylyltransferase (CMP-KDO synthetase)